MISLAPFLCALLLLFLFKYVSVLENGLARTPPMGWMSWGYFMCSTDCKLNPNKCLNEELILSVVDSFYTEGYQEAGYEYIIIDDCWSLPTRDDNGRLVPDPERFPRGMRFIADYIHARGLKFGMYTNIGEDTCMRYPGSRGHFQQDTKLFAGWGVDYIKVDGCFVEDWYLDSAYIKLGHWLNQTGRPMVYSCSWPYYKEYIHKGVFNYSKVIPVCNLWRNFHDVATKWPYVEGIVRHYQAQYDKFAAYHGPGHWHDPDMLILGTAALNESQSRIQMGVYSMLSAPLIISCDMKMITAYERRLLQNLDLVAIAQDPMGIMARPYTLSDDLTLWVKPHMPKKGDIFCSFSFAVVNFGRQGFDVTFKPALYGLNSTDPYTVMNIFANQFIMNITLNDSITVSVPAVDMILYTFCFIVNPNLCAVP